MCTVASLQHSPTPTSALTLQAFDHDPGSGGAGGAPARIFDASSGRLVPYDLASESPAEREEREWADARLRELRKGASRCAGAQELGGVLALNRAPA